MLCLESIIVWSVSIFIIRVEREKAKNKNKKKRKSQYLKGRSGISDFIFGVDCLLMTSCLYDTKSVKLYITFFSGGGETLARTSGWHNTQTLSVSYQQQPPNSLLSDFKI